MNAFDADAALEPDDQEQSFTRTDSGGHRPLEYSLNVFVRVVSLPG